MLSIMSINLKQITHIWRNSFLTTKEKVICSVCCLFIFSLLRGKMEMLIPAKYMFTLHILMHYCTYKIYLILIELCPNCSKAWNVTVFIGSLVLQLSGFRKCPSLCAVTFFGYPGILLCDRVNQVSFLQGEDS